MLEGWTQTQLVLNPTFSLSGASDCPPGKGAQGPSVLQAVTRIQLGSLVSTSVVAGSRHGVLVTLMLIMMALPIRGVVPAFDVTEVIQSLQEHPDVGEVGPASQQTRIKAPGYSKTLQVSWGSRDKVPHAGGTHNRD